LIEDKSPVHYQYKATYIMTAVKSGLMIIDQYRADVRILYERYAEQLRERSGKSQRVLFPEVVHFAPSDAVVLDKILPELSAVGFELSDLGQNAFAINGIPAGIDGMDFVSLLQSIVRDATENISSAADEISHTLALSMARSAAIPHVQVLTNDEMESVVNQLFACSNVNFTPDGKAILCILPQKDIEQLLG
jgi:DNA mismatch repair protein MutL